MWIWTFGVLVSPTLVANLATGLGYQSDTLEKPVNKDLGSRATVVGGALGGNEKELPANPVKSLLSATGH